METLENVLSEESEQSTEPVEQEVETQETTGEEETTPPVEDETPEPVESPEIAAFKAKAQDEKRKRQEWEQRARTLEEQLSQPKEETSEDDFWDNPKEAVSKTLQSEIGKVEQAFNTKLWGMSERLAKKTYTDFDEVMDYFADEIAPQSPHLVEQARQDPDPYDFIYRTAKAQKELAEVGDINALKAKIRAEVVAEMEQSNKTKIEEEIQKRSNLPGTLANERATGGNAKQSKGTESLDDILGR